MKSFLCGGERPLITVLLCATTVDGLLTEIENAKAQGADAFGLMIEKLKKEIRTEENFTKLISAMGDKPCYVTCYKRWDVEEESEEERCGYILLALKCGAVLADVRADLFDAKDGEFSMDKLAVKKQKEFIKRIREMGKEILISTHAVYDGEFKFLPKNQVLKIALEQQKRGADIAKIVTNADSEEELMENFEAITLCRKKVKIPVIFLCNGDKCLRHRFACGLISEPMIFAKEKNYCSENSAQPSVEHVYKLFLETFG